MLVCHIYIRKQKRLLPYASYIAFSICTNSKFQMDNPHRCIQHKKLVHTNGAVTWAYEGTILVILKLTASHGAKNITMYKMIEYV